MKQAWSDLKSFITVSMIVLLFVIVIANLMGLKIEENLLILITNLITAVFTYYFTRKKEETISINSNESEVNDDQNKNN
ncbi:MAG: hypothetical protein IKL68_02210 [Clostridia bacterium]|nr:hypothetical protein [Clostridia bacterium]